MFVQKWRRPQFLFCTSIAGLALQLSNKIRLRNSYFTPGEATWTTTCTSCCWVWAWMMPLCWPPSFWPTPGRPKRRSAAHCSSFFESSGYGMSHRQTPKTCAATQKPLVSQCFSLSEWKNYFLAIFYRFRFYFGGCYSTSEICRAAASVCLSSLPRPRAPVASPWGPRVEAPGNSGNFPRKFMEKTPKFPSFCFFLDELWMSHFFHLLVAK